MSYGDVLRKMLHEKHMSQAELAHLAGVDIRTVKRWEDPSKPWEPSQDAWDVLDEASERQRWVVDEARDRAYDLEDELGLRSVALTYWRGRDEYEAAHPGEGHMWQMANANSRLAGAILSMDGFEVRYGFQGLASLEDEA